ncbi:hypothetical protein COHA_000158 [Chlorella ohadii]|uniref:SGNH hydrolase-type esterase domain-containing protein n=1 Tax=Chlorella ohadii TaxID=2649997 RepID=A0AAD5H710_9CHLO|nr:hypothetical protein COHA_000158 [Chlorella ohadii]
MHIAGAASMLAFKTKRQPATGKGATSKFPASASGASSRRHLNLATVVLLPLLVAACYFKQHAWTAPQSWHAYTNAAPTSAGASQLLKERLSSVPWPRILEEEDALRGLTYYGSGRGLHRLADKLLAGQPIKIVAMGGSVTAWAGGNPNGEAYIARFFQYINSTFPHLQHELYNKGMSAWNSAQFEPCLEHIVPEGADLVVVEFAINDASLQRSEARLPAGPSYDSPGRRAFELLLRRLQAMPSRPAVLLLQMYPWWQAFGDGATQGLYYREPETEMTVLAQYYDMPVVSLRAAAWHLMSAGIEGFKIDKVLAQPNRNFGNTSHVVPLANVTTERGLYFYYDCVHPDSHGLRTLAELLIHPVARAVHEVAAGLQPKRRTDPRLEGRRPPMIPNSPDLSPSLCFMLEGFKPVVKAAEGFEYRALKPNATNFVQQKWGYYGTKPGDWAEMELDTQMDAAHPQATTSVYLTYLTSWKDMGTARVTCTGCECKPMDINAHVPMAVTTVFFNRLIPVSQHKQCRIRITILEAKEPSQQQSQHFMIAAAMLRSDLGLQPSAPSCAQAATPPNPYVALCLSVKDEWAELPEWVEHHLKVGVGKMYILDDGSQPPMSTVLAPYIASGAVEYHWFEGVPQPPQPFAAPSPAAAERVGAGAAAPVLPELLSGFNYSNGERFQLFAYDWCMQHHRNDHTWMGFVDVDEYIILRADIPSLPELLQRYEQFGGLALFSKIFGTNGHKTRPAGGTRQGFTKCAPAMQKEYYKTIANLHYVLPTIGKFGPHAFRMRDGAKTVNSRGLTVISGESERVVKDEIFLHHYWTRSEEEFAAKLQRGGGIHKTNRFNTGHMTFVDTTCTLDCLDAVRYTSDSEGAQ